MTSTVTACCGSNKEVRVRIQEDQQPNVNQVLEDGESGDFTIFDSRTVIVGEFEKEMAEQGDDTAVDPDERGEDTPVD